MTNTREKLSKKHSEAKALHEKVNSMFTELGYELIRDRYDEQVFRKGEADDFTLIRFWSWSEADDGPVVVIEKTRKGEAVYITPELYKAIGAKMEQMKFL